MCVVVNIVTNWRLPASKKICQWQKERLTKKNPTQCTRIHHVRDNNSGNHNEIMKKDNILYINSIQWSVRLRIFAELNTLSVAAGDAGIQLLKSSGRDKIKSERQKLIIIEKKTMKHAKKYIRMCVCIKLTIRRYVGLLEYFPFHNVYLELYIAHNEMMYVICCTFEPFLDLVVFCASVCVSLQWDFDYSSAIIFILCAKYFQPSLQSFLVE